MFSGKTEHQGNPWYLA